MKFDWTKFMDKNNKIAVRCKTEEEAKDFRKQAREHNVNLAFDCKQMYGSNTCYGNHISFGRVDTYKEQDYTILEWSDYMNDDFTKADLKVGDIVKIRKGYYLAILPNNMSSDGLSTFSKITIGCHCYLHTYNEDLTHISNKECDIVAVLRGSEANKGENIYSLLQTILACNDKEIVDDEFKYVRWDWERKEEPIKELTMEELEKHFGCKIKIIAEE